MDIAKRTINPVWTPENLVSILPGLTSHLLEMLPLQQGSRVLDLATGCGTCALAFAHRGMRVAAVDIKMSQSSTCAAQAKDQKVRIDVLVTDCRNLPFADRSFDLITGTGALSNMDHPVETLREAVRVLKPGGALGLGDFLLPEVAHEVWGLVSVLKYGSRRPYVDYAQLQDLLDDAGLRVTAYRPLRWIYPLAKTTNSLNVSEDVKRLYFRVVRDIGPAVHRALRLRDRNGQLTVVYDCFALVATRSSEPSTWQWWYEG